MTRPVAALSSELLVRKGMALPLGLEPTERTPLDVALTVRPPNGRTGANVHRLAPTAAGPAIRVRGATGRLAGAWRALASRWGVPTILFIAGLTMVSVVAVSGPGSAPAVAVVGYSASDSRPLGPTPVTWVDNGLIANPALAGR